MVGGLVGLYTGKGKSSSNKALRSLGGAAVGSAVGGTMARGTELIYTVSLVEGGTVRIVMDSGNFHRGDCVAVEQGGASANMRRVSEEFCSHNAGVPQQYKAEHQKEANECDQAKQQLLDAQTEDAIKAAQMKMNILCQDYSSDWVDYAPLIVVGRLDDSHTTLFYRNYWSRREDLNPRPADYKSATTAIYPR